MNNFDYLEFYSICKSIQNWRYERQKNTFPIPIKCVHCKIEETVSGYIICPKCRRVYMDGNYILGHGYEKVTAVNSYKEFISTVITGVLNGHK